MSLTQSTSRGLLWIGAIALAIFGAVTFVAPTAILDQFPWRVGPFLAQTIGGWALGMAAMAAASAYRWRPAEVIPSLTTVWLFGAGELLVVLLFARQAAHQLARDALPAGDAGPPRQRHRRRRVARPRATAAPLR